MTTRISAVLAATLLVAGCDGGTTLTGTGTATSAAQEAAGGAGGTGAVAACDAARTAADACVQDALAACPDDDAALKACLEANRPPDRDGDDDGAGGGNVRPPRLPPPGVEIPDGAPCKAEIEAVRTCLADCADELTAAHDACKGAGCDGDHRGPHGKGHGGRGPPDGHGPPGGRPPGR
jgi:hypothetical protein